LASGHGARTAVHAPARRSRWQFDWSLGAIGYTGCPKDAQAAPGVVDPCRHPAFVHGAASADIRIVVTRTRGGFDRVSLAWAKELMAAIDAYNHDVLNRR